MSSGRDDLRVVEGGDHDEQETPSPLRRPSKKKGKKKDAPPPEDGGEDESPRETPTVSHAPSETKDGLQCMVTRKLPPSGWRGACDTGLAGYVASHDMRVILQLVENRWGGGTYKFDFFKGGQPVGDSREVELPGDPEPLREPPQAAQPYSGGGYPPDYGYAGSYNGGPSYAPEPPFVGYPPHGGGRWTPPSTSTEDELREELERLRKEREEEKARREREQFEERLEKRLTALQQPQGPNPMETYLRMMQAQAEQDRQRWERERAEEKERREREERARERREAEERERREQERRERLEREEREERRRAEERKEREAREERLAAEQRSFMQVMAKQNSPEVMLGLLSNLKGLMAPQADPLQQVERLLEVTQMVRETSDGKSEDDAPQGLLGGLGRLAKGVGDYLESRAQEPPAPAGAPQPNLQQVPAPQLPNGGNGQQQRKAVSTEQRIGRLVLMLKTASDAYKAGNEPADAAKALLGYARSLVDQGHEGVKDDVLELATLADASGEQITQLLTVLKTQITSQKHAGYVDDVAKIVSTPDGVNWIKATLAEIGEAVAS